MTSEKEKKTWANGISSHDGGSEFIHAQDNFDVDVAQNIPFFRRDDLRKTSRLRFEIVDA